jgi:steroid 5-alpha reductase family enzyme
MNFAMVTEAALLTVIVVHGATFFIARRVGRDNVVDIAWGIGFVAVAAVVAAQGSGDLFAELWFSR